MTLVAPPYLSGGVWSGGGGGPCVQVKRAAAKSSFAEFRAGVPRDLRPAAGG